MICRQNLVFELFESKGWQEFQETKVEKLYLIVKADPSDSVEKV
jgi:hypothetical protein